jgi:hypothetical protein
MHSSIQHISALLYNIGYMWAMCLRGRVGDVRTTSREERASPCVTIKGFASLPLGLFHPVKPDARNIMEAAAMIFCCCQAWGADELFERPVKNELLSES